MRRILYAAAIALVLAAAIAVAPRRTGHASSDPADAASALRADLKSFSARADGLSPDAAASQWLALLARQGNGPSREHGTDPRIQLKTTEVIAAMPGPAAWPALAAALGKGDGAAPPDLALRLVAAILRSDEPAEWQLYEKLKSTVQSASARQAGDISYLGRSLMWSTDDPARFAEAFEDQLGALRAADEPNLQIPDVARLAPDRARALLREALAAPGYRTVQFFDHPETRSLARQVALEMGAELRIAPWELVRLDQVELYEVLDRQFPGATSPERREAAGWHALGLMARRQFDAAAAACTELAKSGPDAKGNALPELGLEALADRGLAPETAAFLGRLLAAHPELPFWADYREAATMAGEAETALPLLKDHSPLNYARALLAADHAEEGANVLRELLKSGDLAGDVARQAFCVGEVLHDDPLLKAGAAASLARYGREASDGSETMPDELIAELTAAGRGAEVEAALQAQKAKALAALDRLNVRRLPEEAARGYHETVREPMFRLAAYYADAGRPKDAVALLEKSPDWGARDLAQVLPDQSAHDIQAVAKALAVTGHPVLQVQPALRDEAALCEEAGLLTRSIAKSEQAVAAAPESYEAHLRLAMRLEEAGRVNEATPHYATAYASMPPGASTHFCCNQIFPSRRAQAIAERAFQKRVQDGPDRWENHDLLGKLYEEQDRLPDAVASYREAARLNPKCLDAWQAIGRLAANRHERSEALLAALRVDPRAAVEIREIIDARALWEVQETARKSRSPASPRLFPLPASARVLDLQDARVSATDRRDYDQIAAWDRPTPHGLEPTPADLVLETSVMDAALRLADDPR